MFDSLDSLIVCFPFRLFRMVAGILLSKNLQCFLCCVTEMLICLMEPPKGIIKVACLSVGLSNISSPVVLSPMTQ